MRALLLRELELFGGMEAFGSGSAGAVQLGRQVLVFI